MKRTTMTAPLAVVAGLAAFGWAGQAHAVLADCPASFTANGTAKVNVSGASTDTAASDCEYISPPDQSNVANETNVNAAGFFGSSDWSLFQISQVDPPNDQSGSFSLSGANFATNDYIVVFKDGADTNLVAFLLIDQTGDPDNYDWLSPFTEPPFDFTNDSTIRDVSHFSVFTREGDGPNGGGGPVPEPAAMALFGVGLAALGLTMRRRRRA